MAADEDRALIYDRNWQTAGEFMVSLTDAGQATVRSGPRDRLTPGELYQASIYGRYYECTPEQVGDQLVLRLNGWGRDVTVAGVA
jgi:hypothetical protein